MTNVDRISGKVRDEGIISGNLTSPQLSAGVNSTSGKRSVTNVDRISGMVRDQGIISGNLTPTHLLAGAVTVTGISPKSRPPRIVSPKILFSPLVTNQQMTVFTQLPARRISNNGQKPQCSEREEAENDLRVLNQANLDEIEQEEDFQDAVDVSFDGGGGGREGDDGDGDGGGGGGGRGGGDGDD